MDAHVTADATEQWIRLALRDDVAFDLEAIAAKVPDCGYKLRRIEVEAEGRLEEDANLAQQAVVREQLRVPSHGSDLEAIGQLSEALADESDLR